MILPVVVSPHLFDAVADDLSNSELYWNWCLQLLLDLLDYAVLYVDREGLIENAYQDGIDCWPSSHRELAKECWERLFVRHRFVEVDIQGLDAECPLCDRVTAVASSVDVAPTLIAPTECLCGRGPMCGLSKLGGNSPFDLETVRLLNSARSKISFVHGKNEILKSEFEQRIFDQLLMHASSVEIIDRQIGRSAEGVPMEIKQRFADGIRWVLERYVAKCSETGDFIVVTDCDPGLPRTKRQELLSSAEAFEDSLRARCAELGSDLVPQVVVKEAQGEGRALVHDRYLITDQFGVLFSRGFDLFDGDDKVRDGAAMLLPYEVAKQANRYVRGLPTLT